MQAMKGGIPAVQQVAGTHRGRLLDYIELLKPRLLLMVAIVAGAGFALGSRATLDWQGLGLCVLGIVLVGGGAGALNQLLEVELDRRMARTSSRPLPSGRLGQVAPLLLGAVLVAAGVVLLARGCNDRSAWLALLMVVLYVAVYTPMKRFSALNTLVGAVPGALPVVIGYTAAGNLLDRRAIALFSILFLWQLPHFLSIAWIYRDQYRRAGFQMLPVIESGESMTARQVVIQGAGLVLVSVLPYGLGMAGQVYLVAAVTLSLAYLAFGIHFALERSDRAARRLLRASLLYLPALFLIMAIDRIS